MFRIVSRTLKSVLRLMLGFAIGVLLWSGHTAFAQRGMTSESSLPRTRLTGFPGMFDTFVPDKGRWVTQVSTVATLAFTGAPVDYGLTENMSVGTNALVPLLWLAKTPGMIAKVRYSKPILHDLALAFTGYGLYLPTTAKDGKSSAIDLISMATINSSYFFTERNWLNLNVSYFSMWHGQGEVGAADFERSSSAVAFAALGYQHFIFSWLGPRANLFVPLSIESSADAAVGSKLGVGSLSLSSFDASSSLAGSLQVDLRFGERWLVSPGVFYVALGPLAGFTMDFGIRW